MQHGVSSFGRKMFLFSLVYRFFSLCTADIHAVFRAIHAGMSNFQAFLCTVLPKQKHPQPERRRCAEHYMQAVPRIPKPLHSVLCGGFFFRRCPGAPHFFHKCFTFLSFGGSATALSQAVTAASQYRFKSVSNSPSRSTIFSHFVVFLCYLSGLYLCFLGILSIFWYFFKHSPPC